MKKMLIALALLVGICSAATAQTLYREATGRASGTRSRTGYHLFPIPTGMQSPLWLGAEPSGTASDAWVYIAGAPTGFEYAFYSASTLPSKFEGTLTVAGGLITAENGTGAEFEGATADAYETALVVTDPTADRTITFPNASGTTVLSSLLTNAPDAANSVTVASNALLFEGATADGYELSLSPADPGADVTLTLPAETASAMVSALTSNATDAANSVTGASNKLVFEGATADASETVLTPTDPTGDRTITIPDVTGTIQLSTLTQLAGSSAPPVACAGGTAGTIYFDSTISKLCVCNGTNYVLVDDATTTTGCS